MVKIPLYNHTNIGPNRWQYLPASPGPRATAACGPPPQFPFPFAGLAYLECNQTGSWVAKTDYEECTTFLVNLSQVSRTHIIVTRKATNNFASYCHHGHSKTMSNNLIMPE